MRKDGCSLLPSLLHVGVTAMPNHSLRLRLGHHQLTIARCRSYLSFFWVRRLTLPPKRRAKFSARRCSWSFWIGSPTRAPGP
jgi:hypothetical protein